MTIDPYTPAGTKILFNHPRRGTDGDCKNAKQYLQPGVMYTVSAIYIGVFYTRVFLREVSEASFPPPHMFEYVALAHTNEDEWSLNGSPGVNCPDI